MSLRINAPVCPLSTDGQALLRTLLVREQELRDARASVERATADLERANHRQQEAYQAVCDAHPADRETRVCVTPGETRAVYALSVSRNGVTAELLPALPAEAP